MRPSAHYRVHSGHMHRSHLPSAVAGGSGGMPGGSSKLSSGGPGSGGGGGGGGGDISTGSPPLRDVSFVPDSLAGVCFRCAGAFTFTRRKHHCRRCGNVVCGSCSAKKVVLHSGSKDSGGGGATASVAPLHSPLFSGSQASAAIAAAAVAAQAVRVCDACFQQHEEREHRRALEQARARHMARHGGSAAAQQLHAASAAAGGSDFHAQGSFYESSSAALQPDGQPWVEENSQGSSGAQGGWGEAGGRWLSSFGGGWFSSSAAAASSPANVAAASSQNPASPASADAAVPVLMINPNHIEGASSSAAAGALSSAEGPASSTLVSSSLLLQRSHMHALPADLTPKHLAHLVLLLFESYLCLDPAEEKIWLNSGPLVYWTSLPRRHLDSMTSEAEVEESVVRRCRAYVQQVVERVRERRLAWRSFMDSYDYISEAELDPRDDAPPLQAPPHFMPYPCSPPPICTGTLLVTNYQLAFVPDYAVYIYWSHLECVRERWVWNQERRAAKARVRSRRRQGGGGQDGQNGAATGLAIDALSPSSPSVSPSPSPSPCASPGAGEDGALFHSVSLDQPLVAPPIASPRESTVPVRSLSEADVLGAPASAAVDVTQQQLPSPVVVQREHAGRVVHAHSSGDIRDGSPAATSTASAAGAASLRVVSPRSTQAASPRSPTTIQRSQLAVPNAASASMLASSSSSQLSASVTASSIFSASRNMSQRHLPHFRLLQTRAAAPSFALSGSSSSGSCSSTLSFDPLAFAPPLISVPQLSLRRLKHSTQDKLDLGCIELKSKLHHSTLRFLFANLVRNQRFSLFRNVAKCVQHFSTFAPPLAGATIASGPIAGGNNGGGSSQNGTTSSSAAALRAAHSRSPSSPQHRSAQNGAGGGGGNANGVVPAPSSSQASLVPDPPAQSLSEIQRKVFLFKMPWKLDLAQQQHHAASLASAAGLSASQCFSPVDPGWLVYDAVKEYRRMGLIGPPLPSSPGGGPDGSSCHAAGPFRLSLVNSKFSFCPSYPRVFIVPSLVSDGDLLAVANFRSKRRIPVVVWRGPCPAMHAGGGMSMKAMEEGSHGGNGGGGAQGTTSPNGGGSGGNGRSRCALLLRSAQPLTGLTGARCLEDELLLQHACAAVGADRLLIVDCRPMANAIGQAALGAGYENTEWYTTLSSKAPPPASASSTASSASSNSSSVATPVAPPVAAPPLRQAEIAFLNVENIHAMRRTHAAIEKMITRLSEEDAEQEWNASHAGAGGRAEMGVRVFPATQQLQQQQQQQQHQLASRKSGSFAPEGGASHAGPPGGPVSPPLGSPSAAAAAAMVPAPSGSPVPMPPPPPAPSSSPVPAASSASQPLQPFPSPPSFASNWLGAVNSSGHLGHLGAILGGTVHVLTCLAQGIVVLAHCSDGWDRTAQLSSLVQLCADGFFRSIRGFAILLEKEWMSFGHRFQDRLGHGGFTNEVAPVFLQFLECVWQIVAQFPTHFQFDGRLLVWLHHQCYSGAFGSFFFNSEEERERNRAPERTRSVWWYVSTHLEEFVNESYGVGWAKEASSFASSPSANGAAADAEQTSFDPSVAAFASLPVYVDSATLYVDTKELRLWSDLYLCYKTTAQGLLWTANQVPSAAGALGAFHPLAGTQQGSGNNGASGATSFLGSHHANPALDLNPTQWIVESRARASQIESLQTQLEQSQSSERAARDAAAAAAAELAVLRAELERTIIAAVLGEIVSKVVTKAEVEAAEAKPRVLQACEHDMLPPSSATATTARASTPLSTPSSRRNSASLLGDGPLRPSRVIENLFGRQASASSLQSAVGGASPSSSLGDTAQLLLSVPTQLKSKSEWKSDEAAEECPRCRARFSRFTQRKHHWFDTHFLCDACSPKKPMLVIRAREYKSGREESAAPGPGVEAGSATAAADAPVEDTVRVCADCENRICSRAREASRSFEATVVHAGRLASGGGGRAGSLFHPGSSSPSSAISTQPIPMRRGTVHGGSSVPASSSSAAFLGGVGQVASSYSSSLLAAVSRAVTSSASRFTPAASSSARTERAHSMTHAGTAGLSRTSGGFGGRDGATEDEERVGDTDEDN